VGIDDQNLVAGRQALVDAIHGLPKNPRVTGPYGLDVPCLDGDG
jgi:hypothetical protein